MLHLARSVDSIRLFIQSIIRQRLRTIHTIGNLMGIQAVSALSGLVYSKLLALYVRPEELGMYNLQMAAMMLFHAVLISPSIQAFMATFQQHGPARSLSFYSGVLCFLCSIALAFAGILQQLAPLKGTTFLIWIGLTVQGYYLINASYLLVVAQRKTYLGLQALNTLLITGFLALLILFQQPIFSVTLWLIFIITTAFTALLATGRLGQLRTDYTYTPSWLFSKTNNDLLTEYKRYTTPLFLYALFGWLINYADRYLIERMITVQDVGFYSVGYSIGSRMLILASPFSTHLMPILFELRDTNKPASESHATIWQHIVLFWLLALPINIVLFCFRVPIGQLLLSTEYTPSFRIIPLIAFAYSCLITIQLLETKFYAYGQTKYVLFHSVSGALVNIVLNFLFIPKWGILGAALSMVGSTCCQLLIVWLLFNDWAITAWCRIKKSVVHSFIL